MLITIISWLLSRNLSKKSRVRLMNLVLSTLDAVPTSAVIRYDEDGALLIRGEPIDYERARVLRDHAKVLLENRARNLVREQVAFYAVTKGFHEAENMEQMMFHKAALWWSQQEDKLYQLLAGEGTPPIGD